MDLRTPEPTPGRSLPPAGPLESEPPGTLGTLGLINGRYEVRSQDIYGWPDQFPEDVFNLILCLAGGSVWGAYDFGLIYGIMHIPQRPLRASYDRIPLQWRGRDRGEGDVSFGPPDGGWIQFLGNGKIEGEFNCYGRSRFFGHRVSGYERRAPRDASSMQDEWFRYNESEYERRIVDRWR